MAEKRRAKSGVVKILAWRNPGPLGREPRWDLEVVHEDGDRDRVVGLDGESVKRLLGVATRAGKKSRKETE